MTDPYHRIIETNGIRLHIAEMGQGPLVIMCHGFPELWYSWRHQLPAVAEAGYKAVAPDMRGYGQSVKPDAIEAYNVLELAADMVGLVHALGRKRAVIVGHDWGSPVAWHAALLRPDVFRAVALLSVPYSKRPWTRTPPTESMRAIFGENNFYQLYFQEPGFAEKEIEADMRSFLLKFLYSLSGDATPGKEWRYVVGPDERMIDGIYLPDQLPDWLTEQDLDTFAVPFEEHGITGPLNYYRNIDYNWALTPFLSQAKIRQPSLFIAGQRDGVLTMMKNSVDRIEDDMPDLREKAILPGAGHWIQQERPAEVNELLIHFLDGL